MLFSRDWLQAYFTETLPANEEIARILTMRSFEVEGFEEKKLHDGSTDVVFDIKILPDRAHYALSHRGIAGEIGAALGLSYDTLPRFSVSAIPDKAVAGDLAAPHISIQTPLCNRFMAFHVDLGSVASVKTPSYMVRRLDAVGQRSIHPLVDITNYVKYDIGQPMHAFDRVGIEGDLSAREGCEGESLETLEGKPVSVGPGIVVIADEKRPLDIAGIKGGKYAEINTASKDIFVLSPNFNAAAIRRASQKTGIRTDAGKRFENNLPPVLCEEGLVLTALLINTLYTDAKRSAFVDIYPSPILPRSVAIQGTYLNERLGFSPSSKEIIETLIRAGIEVRDAEAAEGRQEEAQTYICTPPLWRNDIVIPDDIVDEIGRAIGYDHVTSVLPPKIDKVPVGTKNGIETSGIRDAQKAACMESLIKARQQARIVRAALVNLGFAEVYTPTIVDRGVVEIANPLAADKKALRINLAENAERSLDVNTLNASVLGLDTIRQFEVGTVFPERTNEYQSLVLAIAQTKKSKVKAIDLINEAVIALIHAHAAQGKQAVSSEALSQPIQKRIEEARKKYPGTKCILEIPLHEIFDGKNADASVGTSTGIFAGPSSSPSSFSLDKKFKQFSSQPAIVRDIALFVPKDVSSDTVWNVLGKALCDSGGADFVVRYGQFDTFAKDNQISYAYRIVFQAMDKTLSDGEVEVWMESLYNAAKASGWNIR